MLNMKIKTLKTITFCAFVFCGISASAQTPVYLDKNQPIKQRVEDALSRMTLQEKINIIHAQSKFSAPGVPRLGIPELWCTNGPMGIVLRSCGMNGIRQVGPMILAWLFLHFLVWRLHGIPTWLYFIKALEKRLVSATKVYY